MISKDVVLNQPFLKKKTNAIKYLLKVIDVLFEEREQSYQKGLFDGAGQSISNLRSTAYQHANPEQFVKKQVLGD